MSKKADELVYLPLGGAGEIGMNLYLYGLGPEFRRKWIIVDFGISFPGPDLPGVEVTMPDISFIEEERNNLLGIVLTHSHEDHFGALAYLWPRLRVPVYATPFTAAMLRLKLEETDYGNEVPIEELELGSRFELGPFDLELITVNHSIPEPNALAIRTQLGNILHTGDWRIDPDPVIGEAFDKEKFKKFGREGVRAMICDSTNIMSYGSSPSETEIGENLARIIKSAKKRVAVTTFASNAGRLLSVLRAAKAAGRHVVLSGRAMHRIIAAARMANIFPWDGELLREEEYGYLPPEKVVLLCTGSQGESRAALSRIAAGTHPRITLNEGDTVIFSSKTIPGNEREVGAVENNLAAQGVRIIFNGEKKVHVTGHPRRGEVEQMYKWVRPEAAIPNHGETLHLASHVRLAKELGVKETVMALNGDMVRIAPGPLKIIDNAPSGRLCVDGRLILPAVNGAVRERRKLSYAGGVSVFLVLDKKGRLATEPMICKMGLPEEDEYGMPFNDIILDAIDEAMDAIPRTGKNNRAMISEKVRIQVRRAINNAWGKKTECRVQVSRL